MPSFHHIIAPLSLALLISACGETPSSDTDVPPPPRVQSTPAPQTSAASSEPRSAELPSIGPKAQTARKANIDWASARADMQANGEGIVSIQSAGEEPAPVPVLTPTGIVTSQSAQNGPVFRRTDDGYFAFYPGDQYNIIVNGTNETVEADAISSTNAAREPSFSTTVAGAQVWLTRYGADYTVEFECNALADENSTCIDESAAMEIANNLVVSGSR